MQVYPVRVIDSSQGVPPLKKGGHSVEIEMVPTATAHLVMKTTEKPLHVYEEKEVAKIFQIGRPRRAVNVVNWQRLPYLLMLVCASVLISFWIGDFGHEPDTGVNDESLPLRFWVQHPRVAGTLGGIGVFWLLVPVTGFWLNFVTIVVTLVPNNLEETVPTMILRIPTVAYHQLSAADLLRVSWCQ